MTFHVAAYNATVAATALTFLTAATDQVLIQGAATSMYKIPSNLSYILGAYIDGNLTTSARLEAPSLITTYGTYLNLSNIDATDAKVVSASEVPFTDWFDSGIPLTAGDTLQVDCKQSASTSKVVTGIIFLGSNPDQTTLNPIPSGTMMTIRATASVTCVAVSWNLVTAPVLDQALKPGTYAVVGMRYEGATAFAARFVGITKDGSRPGCLGYQDSKTPDVGPDGGRFRYGSAGVWGAFTADNLPQIECFTGTTDSAQTFYIDVIKVG